MNVLVVDVGGSHVKLLATGQPVPAYPAQMPGGGAPMGGTLPGMPPVDTGGLPQGEQVAPTELPDTIA